MYGCTLDEKQQLRCKECDPDVHCSGHGECTEEGKCACFGFDESGEPGVAYSGERCADEMLNCAAVLLDCSFGCERGDDGALRCRPEFATAEDCAAQGYGNCPHGCERDASGAVQCACDAATDCSSAGECNERGECYCYSPWGGTNCLEESRTSSDVFIGFECDGDARPYQQCDVTENPNAPDGAMDLRGYCGPFRKCYAFELSMSPLDVLHSGYDMPQEVVHNPRVTCNADCELSVVEGFTMRGDCPDDPARGCAVRIGRQRLTSMFRPHVTMMRSVCSVEGESCTVQVLVGGLPPLDGTCQRGRCVAQVPYSMVTPPYCPYADVDPRSSDGPPCSFVVDSFAFRGKCVGAGLQNAPEVATCRIDLNAPGAAVLLEPGARTAACALKNSGEACSSVVDQYSGEAWTGVCERWPRGGDDGFLRCTHSWDTSLVARPHALLSRSLACLYREPGNPCQFDISGGVLRGRCALITDDSERQSLVCHAQWPEGYVAHSK